MKNISKTEYEKLTHDILCELRSNSASKGQQYHYERLLALGIDEIVAAKMLLLTTVLIDVGTNRGIIIDEKETETAFSKLPDYGIIKFIESKLH